MSRLPAFISAFIFVFSGSAFSQASAPEHSAPVDWKQYRIPSQKLSISLPKMPVAKKEWDLCRQVEGVAYHAYARGVIYEFEWHTKSSEKVPSWCEAAPRFSKASFTDHIREIKDLKGWTYQESEEKINGRSMTVLRGENPNTTNTRWLLWDDDRWLELSATRRKGTPVDEKAFLKGFALSSSNGADIGSGADATLGDTDTDTGNMAEGKEKKGLALISKPRPAYTIPAREANIQGTVVLRLTFFSNGSVGKISVVKALSDGLTEQAISAAKKIAFLPPTVDGKPVNVTKQIEYTFSIY